MQHQFFYTHLSIQRPPHNILARFLSVSTAMRAAWPTETRVKALREQMTGALRLWNVSCLDPCFPAIADLEGGEVVIWTHCQCNTGLGREKLYDEILNFRWNTFLWDD